MNTFFIGRRISLERVPTRAVVVSVFLRVLGATDSGRLPEWKVWRQAIASVLTGICVILNPLLAHHSYVALLVGRIAAGFLSVISWWRHQMETFSALLALCAGNSPVTGEFPEQRPVTWSFDVLFDLRLNKRLSKQSWGWWFETPSRPLWRHSNAFLCVKSS